MMEEVRQRIFDRVRAGEGPQDMLEGGVYFRLPRKWKRSGCVFGICRREGWLGLLR